MEHQLSLLIGRYGYFGIITALTLGIVGLPLPDEVLLAYVGYNVFQDRMVYQLAVLSAFLGSATGITLSYMVGSKLGLPFLKKVGPKIHLTSDRIDFTERLFEKFGKYFLIVGYFIPGVRHVTAYFAGISNMDLRKFMLFAYIGAFIWSFAFISLGYQLGERWFKVEQYIYNHRIYFLIIFTALIAGIITYVNLKKTKAAP